MQDSIKINNKIKEQMKMETREKINKRLHWGHGGESDAKHFHIIIDLLLDIRSLLVKQIENENK